MEIYYLSDRYVEHGAGRPHVKSWDAAMACRRATALALCLLE
jgi:hypothetical protein